MLKSKFFRKIAIALAFTFLVNAFAVNATVKIYAADDGATPLVPNMGMKAITQSNTLIPLFLDKQVGLGDQVFMSWEMPKDSTSGEYQLQYYIDDGKQVTLSVNRTGQEAITVNYDLKVYRNSTFSSLSAAEQKSAGFSVYRHIEGKYISLEKTLAEFNKLLGDGFSVNSEILPQFTLKPDAGFSFLFDNVTVFLRWDKEHNSFYFSTNKIQQGRVYEFNLGSKSSSLGGSPMLYDTTRKVFTGIPSSKFVATPIYRTSQGVDRDARYILDNDLPNKEDKTPAHEKLGIKIQFDTPKTWNDATKKYDKSDGDTVMPLTIAMSHLNDSNLEMQINIDDINKANPKLDTTASNDNFSIPDGISKSSLGITFTMFGKSNAGLAPGLVFDTVLTPESTNSLFTRNTTIEWGKVYTFMKYEVIVKNNKYYIQVTPYKGYSGEYALQAGPSSTMDLSLTMNYSHTNDPAGTATLLMPLSVNSENKLLRYYQIIFSRLEGGSKILSQILKYKAGVADPTITVPTFFEVDRFELTPKAGDVTGKQGVLKLDLAWDLGQYEIVDKIVTLSTGKAVVTYDLSKSLLPNTLTVAPVKFSAVTVEITNPGNTSGSAMAAYSYVDESGNTIKTSPVSLQVIVDPQTDQTHYVARTSIVVQAEHKENRLASKPFLYPNIYYINMKPVLLNGVVIAPGSTSFDNISLSDITPPEVPAPQNVAIGAITTTSIEKGAAKDEVSFNINWSMPSEKLRAYVNSFSYAPENAWISTDIYIAQSEEAYKDDGENSDSAFYNENLFRRWFALSTQFNADFGSDGVLYASKITSDTAIMTPLLPDQTEHKDAREALRAGEIVGIEVPMTKDKINAMILSGSAVNVSHKIDGLDKNQKYYVYVDIVVSYLDENGDLVYYTDENMNSVPFVKGSRVSSLLALTTKGDLELPKPEEKIPSSPNLTVDKSSIKSDRLTLNWDKIDPATGEVIEYQLIRLHDTPMENKYLDYRVDFPVVWNSHLAGIEKKGLETDSSAVKIYDGAKFISMGALEYEYDKNTQVVKYTDLTLSPNQIYFFYARTVKRVGNSVTYSAWARVTSTTNPVQSPGRLLIESARTDYDHEREVMFSFDAPVSDLSRLGVDFTLEYQLKEEGKDWNVPVKMNSDTLRTSAKGTATQGIYNFMYKISSLTPGTGYTLRVRMVDKNGDASLYTNPVTFRTDVNQQEYDDQDAVDIWSRYLNDELQNLMKVPYWLITDTTSQLEVVYRSNMFNSLITSAVDSMIELHTTSANEAVYYLPAMSLIAANGSSKGFKITHGNMDFIIPARTIETNLNSVVTKIHEKVKSGSMKDYYIKLSFNWRDVNVLVDGNQPTTQQVSYKVEAVGVTKVIESWDNAMLKKFEDNVDAKGKDAEVIKLIKDKVKAGASDQEITSYVASIIKSLHVEFIKTVENELEKMSTDKFNFAKLDRNVVMVAKNTDEALTVNGYEFLGGQWILEETVSFALGRSINVNRPGTFIFTGRSVVINALEGTENGAAITGIVTKYALEDFFGQISLENLNASVTRDMMIGSVARMAGAPKGIDSADWLNKNKKISVSKRNAYQPIETQEALYLLMSLYEMKTNIKVSSIKVRNYNTVAGITDLDDKYKPYVRAAFETGLFSDKGMKARGEIKTKDILNILGSLDKKIKI